MRTILAFLLLGCCLAAEAHIGSPNVFLEDKAGEYPIRVVIRPPQVVPGLAEITVRLQEPVRRVTVLPVFSRAGREGSPSPDEAKLLRGETNVYSAQLWLMESGAYSVDVTIEGPRGKGTLVVPVNSIATNTRPMSRGYVIMLSLLAMVLFLGGLTIAGAIFGESRLDPGVLPTRKDLWRGRAAMVLTAGVLSLLVFAGKKWWDFEDRNYRNNALYKPVAVSAQVRREHDQLVLTIKVDPSEHRGRWTPLIADHGKLMHLFLVGDGTAGAFAHLHPVLRSEVEFEVPLPPLPAGPYHIYADVTHEDGFAETLVATITIPPASLAMKRLLLANSLEPICSTAVAQMLATNLFFPPDPDDSWHMDSRATTSRQKTRLSEEIAPPIADAGGGYKLVWENPKSLARDQDASFRFKLLAPSGQPAQIEPYMGMLGHAVVRRHDGAVFAHVHPVGTFSMAAQEYFALGKPQDPTQAQLGVSVTKPSLFPELHSRHSNQGGAVGGVSFPYAFPQPGLYRFWIQVKSQGTILTGVFDTTVAEAK